MTRTIEKGKPGLKSYRSIFEDYGETHLSYLDYHLDRFLVTKDLVDEKFDKSSNDEIQVLDVGAHWLHQTMLYATDDQRNYKVTAVDQPFSFGRDHVQRMAEDFGIILAPVDELTEENCLAELASDTFDLVIFSEIIEHMTPNPVEFWKEAYRVMKPGGLIVVTTPNFYYWRKFSHEVVRVLRGNGAGISVESLLKEKTTAPHWKEFSRKELASYFTILSPDFKIDRSLYVSLEYRKNFVGRVYRAVENLIPIFRKNLHLEIRLDEKDQGIVITPTW